MRKFVISTVAAAAAFGVLGAFAPAASAIGDTTTTSEVAGYPPVPTSAATTTTDDDDDDQGEDDDDQDQAGPVVITPPASVGGAAVGAGALPSTGSDSMVPLQVAGGLLVAGVLAVFAVRRRRQASPEPAA